MQANTIRARLILGLIVTGFMIGFGSTAYLPLEEPFKQGYGFSMQLAHGCLNIASAAQVIGFVFFGRWSDRTSTRSALMLSSGIACIGGLLFIPATPLAVLMSRGLTGFSAGALVTCLTAIGNDMLGQDRTRTTAMLFASILGGNAWGIMCMAVAVQVHLGPWSWGLTLSAVAGANMIAVGRLRSLPESEELTIDAGRPLTAIRKQLVLLLILSFFSAGSAGTFVMARTDCVGMEAATNSWAAWAPFALVDVLSALTVLFFVVPRLFLVHRAYGLAAALMTAAIAEMLPTFLPAGLLLGLVFFTVAMFLVDAFWSGLLIQIVGSASRGSLTALALCVASLGRAVIPTLVSMSGATPTIGFISAAGSAIIACLLALLIGRSSA